MATEINGTIISWSDTDERAVVLRDQIANRFGEDLGEAASQSDVALSLLHFVRHATAGNFGWTVGSVKETEFRCEICDFTGMEPMIAGGVGHVVGGEEVWKYVATADTFCRAVVQCVLLIPPEKLEKRT